MKTTIRTIVITTFLAFNVHTSAYAQTSIDLRTDGRIVIKSRLTWIQSRVGAYNLSLGLGGSLIGSVPPLKLDAKLRDRLVETTVIGLVIPPGRTPVTDRRGNTIQKWLIGFLHDNETLPDDFEVSEADFHALRNASVDEKTAMVERAYGDYVVALETGKTIDSSALVAKMNSATSGDPILSLYAGYLLNNLDVTKLGKDSSEYVTRYRVAAEKCLDRVSFRLANSLGSQGGPGILIYDFDRGKAGTAFSRDELVNKLVKMPSDQFVGSVHYGSKDLAYKTWVGSSLVVVPISDSLPSGVHTAPDLAKAIVASGKRLARLTQFPSNLESFGILEPGKNYQAGDVVSYKVEATIAADGQSIDSGFEIKYTTLTATTNSGSTIDVSLASNSQFASFAPSEGLKESLSFDKFGQVISAEPQDGGKRFVHDLSVAQYLGSEDLVVGEGKEFETRAPNDPSVVWKHTVKLLSLVSHVASVAITADRIASNTSDVFSLDGTLTVDAITKKVLRFEGQVKLGAPVPNGQSAIKPVVIKIVISPGTADDLDKRLKGH